MIAEVRLRDYFLFYDRVGSKNLIQGSSGEDFYRSKQEGKESSGGIGFKMEA